MKKMAKMILSGAILLEGACTSIIVDESLKKVDTLPKWVVSLGRSTMSTIISCGTLYLVYSVYKNNTNEETLEKEDIDDPLDDEMEFEFEDDLD